MLDGLTLDVALGSPVGVGRRESPGVDAHTVVLEVIADFAVGASCASESDTVLTDEPIESAGLDELHQPGMGVDLRAPVAETMVGAALAGDDDVLGDLPVEGFGQGVIEAVLVVEAFAFGLGFGGDGGPGDGACGHLVSDLPS